MATASGLTDEQINHYRTKGWVIIRGCVDVSVARAFASTTLVPALLPVDLANPETWHTGEKWHRGKSNNNRYGAHVSIRPQVDPPPELFAATGTLRAALDALLVAPARAQQVNVASTSSLRRRRRRLAIYKPPSESYKFGSCVVRYPRRGTTAAQWRAPFLGWHVDGNGWQHFLHSRQQAATALPIFSELTAGGGSTAVVSGSHRHIARLLHAGEVGGLHYIRLFIEAHLVACPSTNNFSRKAFSQILELQIRGGAQACTDRPSDLSAAL